MTAPPWTLPMISAPDFLSRTDLTEAAARVVAEAARAEAVREVEELSATGRKMDAIYKALDVYGIDASHVTELTYVPELGAAAEMFTDGRVRVGDGAFKSAAWLGSTLAHEIEVHLNGQFLAGRWYTGPMGSNVHHVEAYDHEIANATRFGLSKEELASLTRRRNAHYLRLDSDYRARVDAGIYDMKPGEEDK